MSKLFKLLFLLNLLAIIGIWFTNSGYLFGKGIPQSMIALGRISGLIFEYLILLQLVLISRIHFIEKYFGHDKLNYIHRKIGYYLVSFLILHPVLIILGHAGLNEIGYIEQFNIFISSWEHVLLAAIGFGLLLFAGIASARKIRSKVKYETWHFVHLLIYVGVGLAFFHQIETADVNSGAPLTYWLILNLSVFGFLILYRFLRPIYYFFRHNFRVAKVVQETTDVTSVYIEGKKLDKFKYEPGQFAIIYFLAKGMWSGHPFSFSVAPNGNFIRFSIKALGDFTKKIPDLKAGTKVIIDGPLGRFTEKAAKKDKYLFIAGGIGITPFRALTESLSKKNKDILLLYSNRTKNGTVFEKEFAEMPIKKYFFLTEDIGFDYYGFQKGMIDKDKITELAPDYKERDIYVCGPPPMMETILKILQELGVNPKMIHMEKFSF